MRVDAKNLECPLPLLRLKQAIHKHPDTNQFELISSDPATLSEVQIFCSSFCYRITSISDENGSLCVEISLKN